MAYEWERTEHRAAVRAMNEWERAVAYNEARRHAGIVGDADDEGKPCADSDDE